MRRRVRRGEEIERRREREIKKGREKRKEERKERKRKEKKRKKGEGRGRGVGRGGDKNVAAALIDIGPGLAGGSILVSKSYQPNYQSIACNRV